MRLASVFHNSRPAIVALRDGQHVLVRENAELGADMSFAELVSEARSCDVVVPEDDLTWRPVVPKPRRIICLGLNYRAHVEETGRDLPTYPVLFTKWASSLTAAGAPVALPPESDQVDYEGELAVIIGREGRRIAPADALDHVAGLSVANDITMRDYQHRTHQWLQGKAWDASTPLGPYLVTLEEIGDVGHLDLRLELNGREMQSSNTELLIFDVPTTIACISEFTTLQPGDVILTGTPGGVGARRDPQVFLKPGDVVRVEIPEVGILENAITSEAAAQAP
jgi:acylpyruvate hydrolase